MKGKVFLRDICTVKTNSKTSYFKIWSGRLLTCRNALIHKVLCYVTLRYHTHLYIMGVAL